LIGVVCLGEGIALCWYMRDNRRLLERLVVKSETDRNVNRQLAQTITEAVAAATPRRAPRRPTRAHGEPVK
jgi:hypothetical protein